MKFIKKCIEILVLKCITGRGRFSFFPSCLFDLRWHYMIGKSDLFVDKTLHFGTGMCKSLQVGKLNRLCNFSKKNSLKHFITSTGVRELPQQHFKFLMSVSDDSTLIFKSFFLFYIVGENSIFFGFPKKEDKDRR